MIAILFRGKRIANKEWVFGSLIVVGDCTYIVEDDPCVFGGGGIDEYYQVYPETVGQFTGLKDRDDAMIFEGDVVTYRFGIWDPNDKYGLVRWEDGSCGFELFSNSLENCHHCGGGLAAHFCKRAGNIHDNPELIDKVIEEANEDECETESEEI